MQAHRLVYAVCSVLSAALFAGGAAQAQFVQPVAPPFKAQPATGPFDDAFQPYPRGYARNEADTPNSKLFKGLFKTDPRLLFGVSLTPNLALEAGYVNLLDRGFHRIDEQDLRTPDGALGTQGVSLHAAAKVTLPLGDRLRLHSKLGIAHSRMAQDDPMKSRNDPVGSPLTSVDNGPYSSVGAQLKVNERTSITAEYAKHGNAAQTFGRATNAGGFKATLKTGF